MTNIFSKTLSIVMLVSACCLTADNTLGVHLCHKAENIAIEVADNARDAAARAKHKALELAHRTQEAALKAGDAITETVHDIKHKAARDLEAQAVIVEETQYRPVKYAYEVNDQAIGALADSMNEIDRAEQQVHAMRQRLAHDVQMELNAQRDVSDNARRENENALAAIDRAVQAIENAEREIHAMRENLIQTTQVAVEPATVTGKVCAAVHNFKNSIHAHPYRAVGVVCSAALLSAYSYSLGYQDYFNYYSKYSL